MSSGTDESATWIEIAVYGRGKDQITESIEKHFGMPLSLQTDHTWVGVKDAKKALRVTSSGMTESAAALIDLACIVILLVIAVLVALFIFAEAILFVIVIAVLTIFSGGAALKYTRVTYITGNMFEIDIDEIETFTKEQILGGRFARTKADNQDVKFKNITNRATTATHLFRIGIVFSLMVATIFAAFEIVYRLIYGIWLVEYIVLAEFGVAFLLGIVLTDIGALLRRRLRFDIESGYVDGPLRESSQYK